MARTHGLTLQTADRPMLESWARSQTLSHHQMQRVRMLLSLAAGQTLATVAAAVGASDEMVARWRNRYLAEGLEGLADRPRSGRPPTYTDADREAMWKKLRDNPPVGHTRWSLSLMARETGISTAQLSRWSAAAGIQPHRVRPFKLSDTPRFEAKLRDVIAVYEKRNSRRRETVLRRKTPNADSGPPHAGPRPLGHAPAVGGYRRRHPGSHRTDPQNLRNDATRCRAECWGGMGSTGNEQDS